MIAVPEDTLKSWRKLDPAHRARTLAATSFISFRGDEVGDEWRRASCLAIANAQVLDFKIHATRRLLARLPATKTQLLQARLLSRLILNASGGAMENGGLCLDRNSGIPYVPGSAVKGCARRAAIAALQAAAADRKSLLLENIALVFGWAGTDWKEGRKKDGQGNPKDFYSDLCFACTDEAADPGCKIFCQFRAEVAPRLAERLKWIGHLKADQKVWEQLPSFAGAVNFLSAFPLEKDPGIDLDVITCHHQKYYGQVAGYENAPDTEEPIPILFPAISAKHSPVFTFALVTNERGDKNLTDSARSWLKEGLELFGLGGKTNAGYGWFDCSEESQAAAAKFMAEQHQAEERETRLKQQKAEADRTLAEARAVAQARKAATSAMTDEQKSDYDLAQLTDDQFRSWLDNFSKRTLLEQQAMVRALRGSRESFWQALRQKAQRGGKPAQIEQAIRAVNKQMSLGKMP